MSSTSNLDAFVKALLGPELFNWADGYGKQLDKYLATMNLGFAHHLREFYAAYDKPHTEGYWEDFRVGCVPPQCLRACVATAFILGMQQTTRMLGGAARLGRAPEQARRLALSYRGHAHHAPRTTHHARQPRRCTHGAALLALHSWPLLRGFACAQNMAVPSDGRRL